MAVTISLVFLFGLGVGSFLNVVILRGRRGENFRGRSKCESCKITLSPLELIPVVSFIVQKGRCRHCGAALFWQYPIVELGTALLYAGAWLLWQKGLFFSPPQIPSAIFLLASALGLGAAMVIFVSDIRYRIIPNGAVLTLLGIGAVIRVFDQSSLTVSALSALLFSAVIALFWFFSKGTAMGLGDAKLILATSLVVGYPLSIPAFLFTFWSGGAVGILLLVSGIKKLKDPIPFGPFILGGAVLAQFFGQTFLAFSGLSSLL